MPENEQAVPPPHDCDCVTWHSFHFELNEFNNSLQLQPSSTWATHTGLKDSIGIHSHASEQDQSWPGEPKFQLVSLGNRHLLTSVGPCSEPTETSQRVPKTPGLNIVQYLRSRAPFSRATPPQMTRICERYSRWQRLSWICLLQSCACRAY